MKAILFVLFALSAHYLTLAQTTLSAGDIVIIGYNFDNPDQVKFVPLVDLAAGTVLKFTDNGWNGTALSTTEGTDTWTAAANIAKGSVQTLNASAMAFSTSGDQIFVYQGSSTSPSFVFGLTTKPWVNGAIASTTSRKPSGLITGASCIAFTTERDNGKFNNVNNTGNKAFIQTAVCNTTNWGLSDTRISAFPNWFFTINDFSNEPLANPINLNFSNIQSHAYQINFTPVAADGYLMVRSIGSPNTAAPVDGVNYQRGDQLGNSKVLLSGATTSFLVEGTTAGQTDYVQVYAYQGSGAGINYRQLNPLSGSVTTSSTQMGNYYSSLDPASTNFIADLQNRIRSPYVKVSYDQYDETMITHFATRDTTANQRVATCVYSGQNYAYTPPFAWYTATPFSREHTWCVSWTPTNATSAANEYCDQHHLFPVNQNSANAVRSNHPLGEVSTVISSYLDGRYGLDINGNIVYEPKDSHKGDAARALLYMSLRYDGLNGADWTFDYLNNVTLLNLGEDPQVISLLLSWHALDQPDAYEIARNDYVASVQGNRNPFVDHPEWTQHIAFGDLSYIPMAAMEASSEAETHLENAQMQMKIYPNPTSNEGFIHLSASKDECVYLHVYDLQGRVMFTEMANIQEGGQVLELTTETWPRGMYLVSLQSSQGFQSQRWIVE
jgi:endonuclease I